MCRADELELLLCGTAELDFTDLEKGAEYEDFDVDQEIVR
jgi:hypothetical protein